jgi:mRNA interferase MazF
MPTFKQGDVVKVPFPYTDRNTRQHRPALVISNGPIGAEQSLLWVAMITSAANRPWSGDCAIEDYAAAGLPIPSVVRPAKITTIEVRDAEILGRVDDAARGRVLAVIEKFLGR